MDAWIEASDVGRHPGVVAVAVLGDKGGKREWPVSRPAADDGRQLQRTPVIWQRGFFDHLLRNSESYSQKWNYVEQNPVRAGLVENAEDWPYAGQIAYIDRV
ncbi:MAG: transposase [Chthoniobacterales bacterium]